MDLYKSINAATARIQIAKLRRRDSSKRSAGMAPEQVDEPYDMEGPSLDPNEALTPDSHSEFLEWMVDSKNRKDTYTEKDVGAVMEDAIEKDTEFLTTSYISFNQDQDKVKLTEFKKSGIFKKLFLYPKICAEEIAKSCLKNGKHISVRYFLTKFPLYKELNIIILLYIYNILFEPRILSSFLPILLTYSAFATMTAYSCRIFITNVDLLFSSKNIIPLMTDPTEYLGYVTRYSRNKLLNIYGVFSIASLVYFLSIPISQVESDLITAVCFLFFSLSIPMLLMGSQSWFSTLTAILYFMTLSPLHFSSEIKNIALFLLFLSFVLMFWLNVGKGLSVRLSSPVFFLMWGQAFVVSSQFTPLTVTFIQRLILAIMSLLILVTMRHCFIHLLISFIAGFIFSYYLSFFWTSVIACMLFAFSLLITKLLAQHWIQNWFLSLDPFEVTFSRVVWVFFSLFILVGFSQGIVHGSHKLSKLEWGKYKAKCTPENGWKDANEAEHQLRCIHLVGRSVLLQGKVLSVSMNSRENSMEFYFNKLPFFYLGDGFTCLFGQDTLTQEECDSWKEEFDEDICRYSKCVISLGAKFKFEIMFQNLPDTDPDESKVKIEASNNFRDEIIGLRVGEVVNVTAEILNPGSKSLKLKLKCIERLQNMASTEKCTPRLGISASKLEKYFGDLIALIFNTKSEL